jgi:hypothetical protein
MVVRFGKPRWPARVFRRARQHFRPCATWPIRGRERASGLRRHRAGARKAGRLQAGRLKAARLKTGRLASAWRGKIGSAAPDMATPRGPPAPANTRALSFFEHFTRSSLDMLCRVSMPGIRDAYAERGVKKSRRDGSEPGFPGNRGREANRSPSTLGQVAFSRIRPTCPDPVMSHVRDTRHRFPLFSNTL